MLYNFEQSIGADSPDYTFAKGAAPVQYLTDEQVAQSTNVASFGLKDLYTYPEIKDYYRSGQEDLFKVNASAKANLENIYRTQELFRQGKITNTQQINQLYQPSGVVQRKFGDSAVDQFNNPSTVGDDQNGTYAEIAKTDPILVQAIQDASKRNAGLVAAFTMAQNDMGQKLSDIGFLATLQKYNVFTHLPSMLGLAAARNLLTEPGREAERQKILSMSPNDAMDRIEELRKFYLNGDPEEGYKFFQHMLQPNKIEEGQDQFFRMLDIAALPGVGTAGKAVSTLLKAQEISRMAKEFTKRIPEAINGNTLVVVRSATGDAKGAGILRASDEEVKQMLGNPDPNVEAKSSVMSAFNTNLRDIEYGGPSKNGNASYNIIREQAERTGVDMADIAEKTANATGVQQALAMEGVAEQLLKEAVESNPQLYDRVINAMPFQYNKQTGQLTTDLIIANPDGSYLRSAKDVVNLLEKELGLPVGNVHGWALPHTGEASLGAGVRSLETNKVAGKPRITLKNATTAEVNVRDAEGKVIGVRDVSQSQKPVMRPGVFSEGKGFYGVVTVPVNPNSTILKDAFVKLQEGRVGTNIVDQTLGKVAPGLRTPEEVLSHELMAQRKVAMYTPGVFQQLAYNVQGPARKAQRSQVLKFNRAFTRSLENTQKNKQWFNNIPELEDYYMKAEGRLPTDVETNGYFAFKLGRMMDDSFRDLGLTKAAASHGVERHTLTKMVGGAPPLSKGSPEKSTEFLGTTLKEMPIDHPTARVLIQEGDSFKVKRFTQLTDAEKETMAKVVTGERKGIKLWNSESFPLQDFAETKKRDFVQYVVSDKVASRPLGSLKIDRTPGRLEYNFSHYLKQGDFAYDAEITHYLGDKTIMALENRAVGKVTGSALNEARRLIKSGSPEDIAAAQRTVRDLPIEWKMIRDKFDSGEWDINADFHVVPTGKSVSDIPGALGDARNTYRSGSPHNQFAKLFTGADDPYDIFAMKSKGVFNPSLSYNKAEYLDPYVSMHRSLSRMINSQFMEDVKHTSINDWLHKYGDKLNFGKYARQDNPYQAFVHGQIDSTMAPYERAKIEAERQMIKSFNNIPSTQESYVQNIEQWLADQTFEADAPSKRTAALMGKYAFGGAVAAPALLRSFAYRFGLGLFNPSQLFTQLNTFTNIFAIGGLEAASKGTMASILHVISNMPQVGERTLAGLDKMATRFGWKPGEWLEARQHMLDTGFHLVSKETNELRASMYANKLFKSSMGYVFDAGDVFFNAGEKMSRYGSWYTSWHMNPNTSRGMDLVTRQNILNQADLLSGNMTRASRSRLQEGWGSLPSQFLGYYMRQVELFTGSRLSTAQKMKMLGAYTTLYGMGSGLALTGAGLILSPFDQMLTKAAVDHGWLPENSRISQAFHQGLISVMLNVATGRDYSAGTKFGLGPGRGFDIWSESRAPWQMFLGPVGDMIGQTISNINPIVRVGWGAITGNDQRRHLTPDDWRRPLSVVNTFSTFSKLWYAAHYGEWQSKSENPILSDVSLTEASMMALTGLQPEAANRLAMIRDSSKLVSQEIQRLTDQAKLDQMRHFRAVTAGEDSVALEHWRNLNVTMAQIPDDMKTQVWQDIMRANTKSIPDNATYNYFLGRHKLTNNSSDLTQTYFNKVAPIMGK